MPRSEKYFIGPQLLGDIRRVVGRVESEPYRVNGVTQDVRLQDMPRAGGALLRRGTFTQSSWNTAQSVTVTVVGATNTVSVFNYGLPVTRTTAETQSLSVLYGSVGGTLVATEIQQPYGFGLCRLGKTTAQWTKGTLANIPLYEQGTPPSETVGSQAVVGCVNKFATVASGKWVMLMRCANGSHYVIAAEC
jgi:hypothetical protein